MNRCIFALTKVPTPFRFYKLNPDFFWVLFKLPAAHITYHNFLYHSVPPISPVSAAKTAAYPNLLPAAGYVLSHLIPS